MTSLRSPSNYSNSPNGNLETFTRQTVFMMEEAPLASLSLTHVHYVRSVRPTPHYGANVLVLRIPMTLFRMPLHGWLLCRKHCALST